MTFAEYLNKDDDDFNTISEYVISVECEVCRASLAK